MTSGANVAVLEMVKIQAKDKPLPKKMSFCAEQCLLQSLPAEVYVSAGIFRNPILVYHEDWLYISLFFSGLYLFIYLWEGGRWWFHFDYKHLWPKRLVAMVPLCIQQNIPFFKERRGRNCTELFEATTVFSLDDYTNQIIKTFVTAQTEQFFFLLQMVACYCREICLFTVSIHHNLLACHIGT